MKAILAGADFSELNEEMARLKVRKSELEEILAMTPDLVLTKKMIADKLKEDAQHLQDGDIARLVKSYVNKIYAHSDEVIITGGVNLMVAGGRNIFYPRYCLDFILRRNKAAPGWGSDGRRLTAQQ